LREEGAIIPDLSPQEWWLRGRTLFEAGGYARAVTAFEEVLKFAQGGPARSEVRLKLGIARIRLKQYEEARRGLMEVVRSKAGSASQEAVVWLARVLLRQGQDDQFLSLAREVEAGLLSGELKVRFLLLLAAQHADRGRIEEAISTYQQAGKESDQEGLTAEAYWQAGWLLYKVGRYDEAIRSFDRTVRLHPDVPFGWAAQYWKARSLEKAGEPDNALAGYTVLCREAPNSYYCRSARMRAGLPPVGLGNETLEGASESTTVQVPDPREDMLTGDVHYRRAVELRLIGWLREAGEELAVLTGRVREDRGTILGLARALGAAEDHYRALTLTKLFFPDVIQHGGAGVPQTFWELAYPAGYWPAIRELTNAHGPDPHLVAAVIREESEYNPVAVSPAGAVGLMQVMPQTGRTIAGRLGLEGFDREHLFEPCSNIRMGSWYLRHLAEKFDNNLVHMLAAYNAGPEVVSKWVQRFSGGDQDEFIESIPYTETRQYVKKVLRSYREYKRIYGRESKPDFLDKAC
jgi:soluble lytic murein transglycosylase